MKNTVALSAIAGFVIFATSVHSAEIYNKNGNKLDLNGRIKAMHHISDDDKKDGDNTYARMGFKGETQINDQLTGFGRWEYQFSGNKAESEGTKGDKTRLAFAGLKYGSIGSISYGRNYGVAYDVGAFTDVLPEFGGDTYTHTDNFMVKRASGVLTLTNNDFFGLVDGLKLTAQYQGKNERDDLRKAHGDGYGFSASYEFNGFGFVTAYTNSDRTRKQVEGLNGEKDGKPTDSGSVAKGDRAEFWGTGLKYNDNNIYLAAMYAETRNMTPFSSQGVADKTRNLEVVAQYLFDIGLQPSLAFVWSRGQDLIHKNKNCGNQDLVKYIDIGATYYFNKNMSTFIDYKINMLDEDKKFITDTKISTDDILAIGMKYQF